MVVVNKFTKYTHFILVNLTHKTTNIVKIYMKEIARLHGIPKEIVIDINPKFNSNFWKELFKSFGKNLNFSIAYHPQTDGKSSRVNQVIEEILRMYVMDKPPKW